MDILIAILIILLIAATWLIGNTLVQYALIPNVKAANRQTIEQTIHYSDETPKIKKVIQDNKEKLAKNLKRGQMLDNGQDVSIMSEDDFNLRGHTFYQNYPTNRWVIVVHGYQVEEKFMYDYANLYYQAGYNILTYDQRAMGKSGGKYITMGVREKDDLILWAKTLLNRHPDAQIILHGLSMGASTVLASSGQEDFPKEIQAVIADCPYTDIKTILSSELKKRFGLRSFPFINMAALVARIRLGYDIFGQGNFKKMVKNSSTPTLFIHGTSDDFVPYEMSVELYEVHPGPRKEMIAFEGVDHAEALYADPNLYREVIFSFISEQDIF